MLMVASLQRRLQRDTAQDPPAPEGTRLQGIFYPCSSIHNALLTHTTGHALVEGDRRCQLKFIRPIHEIVWPARRRGEWDIPSCVSLLSPGFAVPETSPPPDTTTLPCPEFIAPRLLSSIPIDYLSTPFSSFHRSPTTPLLACSSMSSLLSLLASTSLSVPAAYSASQIHLLREAPHRRGQEEDREAAPQRGGVRRARRHAASRREPARLGHRRTRREGRRCDGARAEVNSIASQMYCAYRDEQESYDPRSDTCAKNGRPVVRL
jgi:hypothetical protein